MNDLTLFTGMAVELLQFIPQRLTMNFRLKIVKRFGLWQLTIATPVIVAGQGVVTTSLDI